MIFVLFLCVVSVFPEADSQTEKKPNYLDLKATSCSINVVTASHKKLENVVLQMKRKLDEIQMDLRNLTQIANKNNKVSHFYKDCGEVYKSGERISGVYTIDPDGSGAFDVFCDQKTAGGGWTVFQKRLDGSVDFYRDWDEYKRGFGNLNGEFWLGLDKISRLSNSGRYKFRVDLEDIEGKTVYAEYSMFAVTNERTKYQLSLGSYSGTAGDSMSGHRGYPFSTKDQDNDSYTSGSCAVNHKGGWWYNQCHSSNLNGVYHHGPHSSYADGVNWHTWKGYNYSAKRSEMKIRKEPF